jgi:hypothetical protein
VKEPTPIWVVWQREVRDSTLDKTAKLVAHTLATFMDRDGVAWPSKDTLARGASLGSGRRAVDAAIDRLEAAGLLEVERTKGRRSFTYRAAGATLTAQQMSGSEGANVASDDTQRRTNRHATSHALRPNVLERVRTSTGGGKRSRAGGAREDLSHLDRSVVR